MQSVINLYNTVCQLLVTFTWVLLETGRRNAPAPATLSLAPEKDCKRVPKAVAERYTTFRKRVCCI